MTDIGPIEYFFCGGVGGVCTVLVGHPFDTLKVRLQTMPLPAAGSEPLYTGMLDCARKLIQKEGFLGLYRGMTAPLTAVAPIFATNFLGYKFGKILLGPKDPKAFTYWHYFITGAFSAIFTTTIMAPAERVKCLLQTQGDGAQAKYKGSFDCMKQLLKEGGLPNLYKGSVATLLRDMPATGVYFLTYEAIKEFLTDKGTRDITFLETIFAGGTTGITYWLAAMPQDVVKTRLQTAEEGKYSGVRDVFRELLKHEGPKAFYKGLAPVMLRAFPANAATFVGFEAGVKFCLFLREFFNRN